jgi:hypothetical protein
MNLRAYIYPLLIVAIISAIFLNGCFSVGDFGEEELLFVKPFSKNQELIFKSPTGQKDTIVFGEATFDTIKYRNIEQGFYNELALSISYKLSPGSFHKVTVTSVKNETEHLLQFTRAKGSHSSKEISFLGLIFDEKYINNIVGKRNNVLNFRKEDAVYSGVNINEGIKSFVFSFDKGIISFVDKSSAEWQRQTD